MNLSIQRKNLQPDEYLSSLTALSDSKKSWMVKPCCGKIIEINPFSFVFEKVKGFFGIVDHTKKQLIHYQLIKFLEHGYHRDLLNGQEEKIQKIARRMGWVIDSNEVDLLKLFETIKTPLEIKIDFIKERLTRCLKREKASSIGSFEHLFQKWLEKYEWGLISKEKFEDVQSLSLKRQTEWKEYAILAKQILQKSTYTEEYLSELCDFYEEFLSSYEDFYMELQSPVKNNKLAVERWSRFTTQIILERGLFSYAKGQHLLDAFISSPIAKPNYARETLLHLACLQQDLPLVKWLLNKGAISNVVDNNGDSPVSLALLKHSTDIVRLLIDHGANVHYSDMFGHSELFNAAFHDNLEVLKLLIEKGANLNQPTDFNITPLSMAILNFKSEEILKFLAENGAKLDEKMESGFTCEHAAYFAQLSLGNVPLVENKEAVELWHRGFLSNVWSLGHKTTLKENNVNLEGGRGRIGIKEIGRAFSDFQTYFKDTSSIEFVKEVLNEKSVYWNTDPKECARRFEDGDTLLFDSGYTGHCISILYFRDYLFILNRGGNSKDSSIFIKKIDREQAHLREKDWKKLLRQPVSPSQAKRFFYENLPILSGASKEDQPDPIISLFHNFLQNDQKIGNCWIVSPKLFPLAILAISELIKLKERSSVQSRIGRFFYHREQRKILDHSYRKVYKPFTTFLRLRSFKNYLQHILDAKEKFGKDALEPDHQLIQTIRRKQLIKYRHRFFSFKTLEREIDELYKKYLVAFEQKGISTFFPFILSCLTLLKPKMLYLRRLSKNNLLWILNKINIRQNVQVKLLILNRF